MSTTYGIPRGTFDILPSESYRWQYIESRFLDLARRFGFQRIVTPIFENADLFERNVGDSSDIVEKEMYRFSDRKGRVFALRPEGTAPVVRSFVENHLGIEGRPARLAYYGPMFRYDRPQKGRYRQFHQYGLEMIGSNHPYTDAEVIHFAVTFLKELGLAHYRLEINSVGCPSCSQAYNQALIEYYTPLSDRLCPDCRERLTKNPRRLLDCKVPSCRELAPDAPVQLDYLDEPCREHFDAVCLYLNEMGLDYTVNPRIVRGLDYYTHTAFEVINEGLGAQNAMLGGGRYNGLVKAIGGDDIPGIGFAGGFERLMDAMLAEGLSFGEQAVPDGYLVALGDNARHYAPGLVARMRSQGLSVDFDIEKVSMKAQIKAADKVGARFALLLGDDELAANSISAKRLVDGTQTSVPLDELSDFLKNA
jgi:histidyl-tRNA synthetase